MREAHLDIKLMLPASEERCAKTACNILKLGGSLCDMLFQKTQPKYFELRDRVPAEMPAHLVMKAAFYHSAWVLYGELKGTGEKVPAGGNAVDKGGAVDALSKALDRPRPSPKEAWLQDHVGFVMDLRAKGVAYRKISQAIGFRFRKSISHTRIREFVLARKRVENGE